MDDREAEGRRLPRARLRAGHQVAAREADRDRVALHGRRLGVLAPGDVGHERRPEVDVGKGRDGLRHVVARGLDRDVLVGVEVDAGVLLGLEEGVDLGLGAGVGLEGVVLAVIFFFFFFGREKDRVKKKKVRVFYFEGKREERERLGVAADDRGTRSIDGSIFFFCRSEKSASSAADRRPLGSKRK